MEKLKELPDINLLDLQIKEILVARKYSFSRFYEKNVQFSRFFQAPRSKFQANPGFPGFPGSVATLDVINHVPKLSGLWGGRMEGQKGRTL